MKNMKKKLFNCSIIWIDKRDATDYYKKYIFFNSIYSTILINFTMYIFCNFVILYFVILKKILRKKKENWCKIL